MQKVTLAMPKSNGTQSEIQLLRPTTWLETQDIATIGKSTYLHLPEMGLEGFATVTDLAHFRVTKSNTASEENSFPFGEGRDGADWAAGLVTGVFKHIANGVYHVRYDNGDTLGVTGTHPLYSLDRQQFIPTEDIKVGEHLLSKSGIITVVSKTYDPTPQEVYNLEVGQWHNFLVGCSGVVVHNNYLAASIQDCIDAIKRKEIKYFVTKHGDYKAYTGRLGIAEGHHGILSAWMDANFLNYGTGARAPSILMDYASHRATVTYHNTIWIPEMMNKYGKIGNKLDWAKVPDIEIAELSKELYKIGNIPAEVVLEYEKQYVHYVSTLTRK